MLTQFEFTEICDALVDCKKLSTKKEDYTLIPTEKWENLVCTFKEVFIASKQRIFEKSIEEEMSR